MQGLLSGTPVSSAADKAIKYCGRKAIHKAAEGECYLGESRSCHFIQQLKQTDESGYKYCGSDKIVRAVRILYRTKADKNNASPKFWPSVKIMDNNENDYEY